MRKIILFAFLFLNASNSFSFEENVKENVQINCGNIFDYDEFDIIGFDILDSNDSESEIAVFNFEKALLNSGSIFVVAAYSSLISDKFGLSRNVIFQTSFWLTDSDPKDSKLLQVIFDGSNKEVEASITYSFVKVDLNGVSSTYYRFFKLNDIKKCKRQGPPVSPKMR